MKKSKIPFIQLLILTTAIVFPKHGLSQSSQYKRQESRPPSNSKSSENIPKDVNEKDSDKLDISDLEKKYWAPKDTDFSVVQNRTYKKELRFAATATLGPVINDSYSRGTNFSLSGNYYLSERVGVELSYIQYNLGNNVMTKEFMNRYGVFPDHNKAKTFIGGAFNWVPIYAKVSLLGKKILYFDMSISPGIGMTTYEQVIGAGNRNKSSMTLTLDFSQMFFLNSRLAVRIDAKNQFYQEEYIKYTSGEFSKNLGAHNFLLLFGVTYFH